MCLALLAIGEHPDFPLVLLHNRDEFLDRPSETAHFWPENPPILAGKDLQAGGTWLAVTRSGRFAFVTNIRRPDLYRKGMRSRGELVIDFICSGEAPLVFCERLELRKDEYNPFNLVVGVGTEVAINSTLGNAGSIGIGLWGLSNGSWDEAWPKVVKAKKGFRRLLSAKEARAEKYLALMADTKPAPVSKLPSTGVGISIEKMLSPIFVQTQNYGTRATSFFAQTHSGQFQFVERTYERSPLNFKEVEFTL